MIRVYLLILTLNCNGDALLNKTEEKITIALMTTLDIRHWILVGEAALNSEDMKNFKVFVTWNLPITYQSTSKLYQYFLGESFPDVNTLIVFKVPNLQTVIKFQNALAKTVTENEEEELSVPYNCFLLLVRPKDSDTFQLIEIYKVKNKTFKFKYGIWSEYFGLVTTKLTLYLRRRDLNGSELVMEYYGEKEVYVTKRQCAHLQVLEDYTKLMNFRFLWVRHPDEEINQYFAVGGDITNLVYPYNSEFYDQRTDHFGPLFKIKVNWYIKRPSFIEQADYYIQPFDDELWFVIFLCLIMSTLVCTLIYCLRRCSIKFENNNDQARLIDFSFSAFENFCNQDGCPRKELLAFRVACFFFRFFALFIVPAYSGTIISYIAARKPVIPFLTLKEFVRNAKYAIGARKDSYSELFFVGNPDPFIESIYQDFYTSVEGSQMSNKLCKGLFALVELDNDIFNYEFKCTPFRIKNPISFVFTASFLPKHSPFRGVFQHNYIRYYSSGIQEKMQTMLTGDRAVYIKPKSFRRATIVQMHQVFSIVPIGILLANFLLLIEIIFKSIKSRFCYRRRRNSRILKLQKIKYTS